MARGSRSSFALLWLRRSYRSDQLIAWRDFRAEHQYTASLFRRPRHDQGSDSEAHGEDDEMALEMKACLVDEVEEVLALWQGADVENEHLNVSIEVKLRLGQRKAISNKEVDVMKDDLSQMDLSGLPYAFEVSVSRVHLSYCGSLSKIGEKRQTNLHNYRTTG